MKTTEWRRIHSRKIQFLIDIDKPIRRRSEWEQNTERNPSSSEGHSFIPPKPKTMSFSHHRRSQSEMHFRISDDFDLEVDLSPSHHFQYPAPLLQDSGSIPQSPQPETARSAHQRSNSADASYSSLVDGIEAKKALSPDKLAELWTADPKRAKRYVRLSPFSSLHSQINLFDWMVRVIQSLQTEATALSAQLSLFQVHICIASFIRHHVVQQMLLAALCLI